MQYEPQTPRRTPPPVFCPSCGSGVAAASAACAACGAANPVATFDTTLNLGASPEQSLANELRRTFASTPSHRLMPPHAARSCSRCNARLGPDAKFCRGCGEAVGGKAQARSEPLYENVVPMPQPAPPPEPESEPLEVRRRRRQMPLAYLDDEFGENLPPPRLQDIDYLDAVLGLRASGILPAPQPPPPAWRRERADAPMARDMPSRDMSAEDPDVPAPVSRARDPRPPRPSEAPSVAVSGAIGFALVALGIAVVVHYFAPNTISGYSAAEFDLKVQMRALEWLNAGILIALVGLLLKR